MVGSAKAAYVLMVVLYNPSGGIDIAGVSMTSKSSCEFYRERPSLVAQNIDYTKYKLKSVHGCMTRGEFNLRYKVKKHFKPRTDI